MDRKTMLPVLLEITGVVAIGAGIGVELARGAEAGWVMITIGSCMVAVGGIIWGKFMRGR